MVDRRVVLLAVVVGLMFIAVAFDPLNLRNKYAAERVFDEAGTGMTGLFSGANLYASVLPGLFLLVLVSLFYLISRDKAPE